MTIDSAAVKIASGAWNWGASHRALDLAREMHKVGMWDGQSIISFHDPQHLHNQVFGVQRRPISDLKPDSEYIIVTQ